MSSFRIHVVVYSLTLLAIVVYPAAAQEEKHSVEQDRGVHQWITSEAFRYFQSRIRGSELEAHMGIFEVDGVFADARQVTVLDGVRDEDRPGKPPLFQGESAMYDPDSPVNRHFCASAKNIYTGLNFPTQYESALTQAENIWSAHGEDNVLARYAAGDKTTAYYYLGHFLHLVQDMTVPAHTHRDIHGSTFGSLFDSYEQGYCVQNFLKYRFNDEPFGEPVLANRAIGIPGSLYELFYVTAEYTDDYDSNDNDGEYTAAGYDNCFFPEDFPSRLLHRPQDARRLDKGLDNEACAVIAHDLLYWSMARTAAAIRFFYKTVDTEGFSARVALRNPVGELSTEESAPTEYAGPGMAKLAVWYDAGGRACPVSGIVRDSVTVQYAHRPDGGVWSEDVVLALASEEDNFSFRVKSGTYRFRAAAENGAGTAARESYRYMSVPGLRFVRVPKGGRVDATEPLSLEVAVAGGVGQISFQWEKDGVDIPGAVESTCALGIPGEEDSGVYRCRVSDESKGMLVTPPICISVVQEGSLPAGGPVSILTALSVIAVCVKRWWRR